MGVYMIKDMKIFINYTLIKINIVETREILKLNYIFFILF